MQRQPPFRSRRFLSFAKTQFSDCCLCRERPGCELHHFGSDGGTGQKPSDNEVARVCTECHIKNGFKRRALIREGKDDILIAFQTDALALNRAYLEHIEAQLPEEEVTDDTW